MFLGVKQNYAAMTRAFLTVAFALGAGIALGVSAISAGLIVARLLGVSS
jgi:hypothetical protein